MLKPSKLDILSTDGVLGADQVTTPDTDKSLESTKQLTSDTEKSSTDDNKNIETGSVVMCKVIEKMVGISILSIVRNLSWSEGSFFG